MEEDGEMLELEPVPKYTVIHDLYKAGNSYSDEILEEQLETALESQIQHIIIEPQQIGDETTKWIQVGNFLHKSSVLSGLLCLTSPLIFPYKYQVYITVPLSSINLLCTTLYDMSWQYDPCCKYQVESNTRKLEILQMQSLSESISAVLVHREDKYRKRLHNFFSGCVVMYLGYKFYKFYRGS